MDAPPQGTSLVPEDRKEAAREHVRDAVQAARKVLEWREIVELVADLPLEEAAWVSSLSKPAAGKTPEPPPAS